MKLQTIGQIAKRVGLRTSALRYYEQQGLLTPSARSEEGYLLIARGHFAFILARLFLALEQEGKDREEAI